MGNWTSGGVVLDAINFDGDDIIITATRLTVKDMMLLSKFFDKEKGVMRFNNPLEVCETAAVILPQHIVSISGCKKQDGTEVTKEEFNAAMGEFYFVPMIGELFTKLMAVSTLNPEQVKN